MPTFAPVLKTGCSSARLEYASGGRVVAGSNPVIPTEDISIDSPNDCRCFFVYIFSW